MAVMSFLTAVDEADIYIKEKMGGTEGNLSLHIDKLQIAGYIGIFSK